MLLRSKSIEFELCDVKLKPLKSDFLIPKTLVLSATMEDL